MIKNIFLFALGTILFTSCCKENEPSTHKVGFYYMDTTSKNEEKASYQLFIDNVYKGDLKALSAAPACGDASLLYCNLDESKHDVEVKNAKGEYVNSEYLQITKCKTKSGTGINSDKVIGGGSNGATCSTKTGADCTIFGFFN